MRRVPPFFAYLTSPVLPQAQGSPEGAVNPVVRGPGPHANKVRILLKYEVNIEQTGESVNGVYQCAKPEFSIRAKRMAP